MNGRRTSTAAGKVAVPQRQARVNVAERLNEECYCITLDQPELMRALDAQVGLAGFADALVASHPSLFSNVPIFIASNTISAMKQVVAAVEAAAHLPSYRAAALAWATPLAAIDFGPTGVLMGYDFHVTPAGPQLIEVNTNAGGAFLNHVLANAQRLCCAGAHALADIASPPHDFGAQILAMFIAEWRRQRGSGQPANIAIIDDSPEAQYLFPEFRLAKELLEKHGIATIITDAGALACDGKKLHLDERRIDFVYNRLVDFALAEPRHAALRAAYEGGIVVLSPNPHVHALLADKRNLTLLSDADHLEQWGLASAHRKALCGAVPKTVLVTPTNADSLWENRRNQFFKPATGHGSKAAYRGDKLTRKVWSDILAGNYVAQAYAEPSARIINRDGIPAELKVDVRLYTYAGTVLLAAARLYQGQTTNMRTPGGGFAPVLELASSSADSSRSKCSI